ncbi:hypothetical protein HN873_053139, partial [Arachis hypogaea]
QVHQGRSTHFVMPGGSIPRWFERRSSGACISFWFRGTKFPYNALCFAILLKDDFPSPLELRPIVTINGNLGSYRFERAMDQLFIFNLNSDPYYEALHLERGWNHAKLSYEAYKNYEDHKEKVPSESIGKEIGMHVWKEESSSIMEDIRFTDPYKMTQLIIMMIMLSIAFPNHKNHPLLLDTCIGLWMLLFLTHTLSGY